MDVTEALLDSWDRQCRIVDAVMTRIDDSNKHFKPSEDGMALDEQLAHMHNTRKWFLKNVAPEIGTPLGKSYIDDKGTPVQNLEELKGMVRASGVAIRQATDELIKKGMVKAGYYDNPILFLQHMVWHDGWHVGLIFLALRLNGQ